ncbi:type IX secretion system anionic LPS delivery protein PorZ [Flavobacterium cyclinae]|uniref:type IX secretion system anionic LPS delivery protein PorZ n=1 Tax=Flavobacterium cyclinae TaxID=2895947 RepID=UPI001E3C7976|nr:two-component regulator propeller domain-containing protein [Flavobacterium cyclinae]UGS20992.1 T9SS type A sorting domain-containing protein [Flavobacterium cyclinae]
MKKTISISLFFVFQIFFGQQSTQLWKGYFSYNEIVDVESATDKVFAATQNALFSKAVASSDLDIYNSITGLKSDVITSIHHSDLFNKTFVGNANGLLLVQNADGSVTTKVDIIEEVPVAPNKKKINDFYEHEGRLYLATDYGISVIDLATSEFIITYFIGPSGEETEVLQTTVLNNELYAVTRSFGIRKGNLNNPNLYDFSQWQTFDANYWNGIITFNNQLVATNINGRTYRYNSSVFQEILNQNQLSVKLKTNNTQIIVTTQNHVYVLDQSLNTVAHITQIPDYAVQFTAASVVNGTLYIGTLKSGLFSTMLNNPTEFIQMSPNGPLQNYTFRVKKGPNKLWVVHGDYTQQFNPYPLDELGISIFNSELGWINKPYEDLLEAKSLSDIAIHPTRPNEVYVTSYFSGMLKFSGDQVEILNNTNTGPNGLESLVIPGNPSYVDIRINSPAFDKDGNLWVTNGLVNKGIKVLRANGQWQSYDLTGITANLDTGRYGSMAIDKNSTKWIAAYNDGVLAFNENYNNKFIVITQDNADLPTAVVNCVAVDNRNQLWIGTAAGLRILSSVDRFISETELSVSSIIIQEGDLAQELFYQQPILDIAVDGANRKWISIADGGVFLVSSNGQQTIYRFDKSNSPLPSNNIVDIEIDGVSGEVFFATDKGLVSFLGTSTKPSDGLGEVYVYPNPVRPNFTGTVKISGLTDKANIKITDIEGNLVHETTSSGGTIEWDTTAFGKYKVASGVYMIFVASQDGLDSTVKKVMIVR